MIIPTDGELFRHERNREDTLYHRLLRRKPARRSGFSVTMTKYNAGRKLTWTCGESLIETLGRACSRQPYGNNVALGEAQYNARSIFDYAPRQTGKGLPESDRGIP